MMNILLLKKNILNADGRISNADNRGCDDISATIRVQSARIRVKKRFSVFLKLLPVILMILAVSLPGRAQEPYDFTSGAIVQNGTDRTPSANTIFDDQMLLKGYPEKYNGLSKEILLEMIKDDTLTSYRSASAIRVFRTKFADEVVSREKKVIEKILLRRLHRTDSPFAQVESMHALCQLDRYHYFKSMVPALIQKLDHYNSAVNENAFNSLNEIIAAGSNRNREARIVFITLRKMLFLSRKRLADVKEPDVKLSRKLKLLRWSIKVLGNQELKKLPKEVINLL